MSHDADTEPPVLPARPRIRSDVVFRPLGDEWVLFDPATRRLHVLNLTAALVWSHCTGEHAVEAIAERVQGAFDASPAPGDVTRDVREALGTFTREGLLA